MSHSTSHDLSDRSISDAQLECVTSHQCLKDDWQSYRLLYSGNFADATVRCKDVEWKVHRSILCTRCAYFAACLDGSFLVGRSNRLMVRRLNEEGSSSIVEFKEEEPYAVEGLLIYLYTLDYPKRESSEFFLPPRQVRNSKPGANATTKDRRDGMPTTDGRTNETGVQRQRRSHRPEYPWQECIALCWIGEKFGAGRLRNLAVANLEDVAEEVLNSSDAMQFLTDIWRLPHDECQKMVPGVMQLAAQYVSNLTVSPLFEGFVATHPSAACLLIRAVGKMLEEVTE